MTDGVTITAAPPPQNPISRTEPYRSHGRPIRDGDLVQWVLTEAPKATTLAGFIDLFAWRLVGEGLPLARATIHVGTLHPQLLGLTARWERDSEFVEQSRILHTIVSAPAYRDSPLRPAVERGETVRHRLDREDATLPLLVELTAAGITDYLVQPLPSHGARHHVMTFATDRSGGFTAADMAMIARVLPAATALIEAEAVRHLLVNVLDTYLGPTIGRHILAGEVQRRQGEEIRAALIATDLRGFTGLSDRYPADELLELLDQYFDAMTSPIQAQGGEVLKFVGDGLLAIFPIQDGDDAAAARAACAAAEEGLVRLAAVNEARTFSARPPLRIGVGLHIGSVFYGNVGAIDRLDFTAIGPAVNLVCRLEGLTKRIDRPLLMSSEIAPLVGRTVESLGFHPVRGFASPEEVFGLA
ncbi:MAG TPA: adenylate/guanylate cyclase domain-containing protein [Stellaceae bacterium]|nr:adenylate/guanylate cyclase domain-containing protein [Stellaceae bacterium]